MTSKANATIFSNQSLPSTQILFSIHTSRRIHTCVPRRNSSNKWQEQNKPTQANNKIFILEQVMKILHGVNFSLKSHGYLVPKANILQARIQICFRFLSVCFPEKFIQVKENINTETRITSS